MTGSGFLARVLFFGLLAAGICFSTRASATSGHPFIRDGATIQLSDWAASKLFDSMDVSVTSVRGKCPDQMYRNFLTKRAVVDRVPIYATPAGWVYAGARGQATCTLGWGYSGVGEARAIKPIYTCTVENVYRI